MHALLEMNTDGALTKLERLELESLVHLATFMQIASTALKK